MSFAPIRAAIESHLADTYALMDPPVTVVFDNTQETPPTEGNAEYVLINIVFPFVTLPILDIAESGIEYIRGTVQIASYASRVIGMKRLEDMALVGIKALNNLKTINQPAGPRVNVGTIEGPEAVIAGDQPYALVNVAAPFTARVP